MPGSIHEQDTDRPPKQSAIDAVLDALEETRAVLDDLNEGQDEICGSLRGIHGSITDSEKTLGGRINAVHEEVKAIGKAVAQLSRDVGRALQVAERNRTAYDAQKKEIESLREELRRASSG